MKQVKKKKKPRIKGVTGRPMCWYWLAGWMDAKRGIVSNDAQSVITSPRILEKSSCFHAHIANRFRYLEEDEAFPLYLEAASLGSEWQVLKNTSLPGACTSEKSGDIRRTANERASVSSKLLRKSEIESRIPILQEHLSLLLNEAVTDSREALYEVERRLNTYLRGVAVARHTSEHTVQEDSSQIHFEEAEFRSRHAESDQFLRSLLEAIHKQKEV